MGRFGPGVTVGDFSPMAFCYADLTAGFGQKRFFSKTSDDAITNAYKITPQEDRQQAAPAEAHATASRGSAIASTTAFGAIRTTWGPTSGKQGVPASQAAATKKTSDSCGQTIQTRH